MAHEGKEWSGIESKHNRLKAHPLRWLTNSDALLSLSCETGNSYRKNPNSELEVLLLYWNSEENNSA